MSGLSAPARAQTLQRLKDEVFDLLIIGGGINGAGVAREATLRGLRVALVEKSDFASGTSSKSSKLLHGGIRYLENLEFGLVFEALSERNHLLELAPHLAHPLRFLIPIFKNSRVSRFKMGLGMWLYDALSLFQAPEMHENLNLQQTRTRVPALQQKDLLGSFVYSDAYMDDDRLVFETLRSAERTGLFTAANYLRVLKQDQSGEFWVNDEETGEKFCIRARHAVGAAGPWTDQVGHLLHAQWMDRLRPTKGVHLTFSRERFPLSCAVVMAVEDRIVFAIPRHEMVIVGTTDTDEKNLPEKVRVDASDVQYLLDVTSRYFPGAELSRKDVISCYVGVRPLVRDEAASTGKTSREHQIWTTDGVTYVCGGKYTTYRLMAQEVLQEVLNFFPIEDRARFARSGSLQALNPLITVENYHRRSEIEPILRDLLSGDALGVSRFVDRFGHEALQFALRFPTRRSVPALEAAVAVHTTACRTLTDFFSRRVPWVLSEKDHGVQYLEEVGEVFQSELKWTNDRLKQEKENFLSRLQAEHASLTP